MTGVTDVGSPHVSVVIPALNEGRNLIDTVSSVAESSNDLAVEIIVVDDGSDDGAPQRIAALEPDRAVPVRVIDGPRAGIASARNAGAAEARAPVIVFLDGHCYVPPGWLEPLIAPFADQSVGLTGPAFTSIREPHNVACGVTWVDPTLGNVWLPATTSGPVPFHIGACQAVRAEAFEQLGGFDRGMTRWGSEDIELCLRMWLSGYEVHAAPSSLVHHLFRTSRPYDVDVAEVLYNHLRMALLHFDERRLAVVLANMSRFEGAAVAMAKAFANGVVAEREMLFARRQHDVEWFFDRFGIEF